jgi:hypothetical protein
MPRSGMVIRPATPAVQGPENTRSNLNMIPMARDQFRSQQEGQKEHRDGHDSPALVDGPSRVCGEIEPQKLQQPIGQETP